MVTAYIGRVLPPLGEDSAHLRALGELVDGVTATRRDSAEVAAVKGAERIADAADRPRPAAPGVGGRFLRFLRVWWPLLTPAGP